MRTPPPREGGGGAHDATRSGLSRKPRASHKALPLGNQGMVHEPALQGDSPTGLGRGLPGRGGHRPPDATLSAVPSGLCRPVSISAEP